MDAFGLSVFSVCLLAIKLLGRKSVHTAISSIVGMKGIFWLTVALHADMRSGVSLRSGPKYMYSVLVDGNRESSGVQIIQMQRLSCKLRDLHESIV
jgi:hypothetical protein